MSADARREEIMSMFRSSREELMGAIDGLTDAQMVDPSIDGWSVKDHLAHISEWDEMRYVEILRVSEGLQPAVPLFGPQEMDQFNELIISKRREWSLQQVLAELEFTRTKILEAIARCNDAALDQSNYRAVGLEGGAQHELEHALHIRNWRGSTDSKPSV
ncbi:MAG TPA: DinB family protein [Actinomycetota bacterium]|nr:DinB family protein [Actinomycetota bacterium]